MHDIVIIEYYSTKYIGKKLHYITNIVSSLYIPSFTHKVFVAFFLFLLFSPSTTPIWDFSNTLMFLARLLLFNLLTIIIFTIPIIQLYYIGTISLKIVTQANDKQESCEISSKRSKLLLFLWQSSLRSRHILHLL